MKIVFMGTPDFAVASLEAVNEKYEVAAVFTQPDKPKGRGNKMVEPPVKKRAKDLGLEVHQPQTLKEDDALELLKSFNADLFIVVAYGRILPERILNIPRLGCVNVHGSLLPSLRGAAPIQRSIINGDEKTGVTTMYMAKGMDTGDMLLKSEMEILPEDTYGSLSDRMSKIGAKLLINTVEDIKNGNVSPVKQDESLATYAPSIDAKIEHINWDMPARDVVNLIKGLNPNPGAYAMLEDKKMKIWFANAIEEEKEGQIGEIIELNKSGIVVKCRQGAAVITRIQAPGKNQMNADDYLRGNKIETGSLFN